MSLILDATALGGRLPVLFVALAYGGGALPLLWRMLPAMGCSECLCLAYVWLMNAGVWVSKHGFRRRLDRHKKRQMRCFQMSAP